MIDSEKLCFERGEKVWSIMIDVNPINDAGNLFDAGALGAVAALIGAKYPVYDGEKIDYKKHEGQLPLNKTAVSVTILKIGKYLIVDPISEEEEVADARLTVAVREDGKLCAMQKGGSEPLSDKELKAMVELAIDKSKELRKLL